MHLMLGARVRCVDAVGGRVAAIAVRPQDGPVYLVVRLGRVRAREVVVSSSMVRPGLSREVGLTITREALAACPDLAAVEVKGFYGEAETGRGSDRLHGVGLAAAERRYVARRTFSVPEESAVLRRTTTVRDAEGAAVGSIEGVVVGDGPLQLIARRGPVWWLVPAAAVTSIASGEIRVRLRRDELSPMRPRPEDPEARTRR